MSDINEGMPRITGDMTVHQRDVVPRRRRGFLSFIRNRKRPAKLAVREESIPKNRTTPDPCWDNYEQVGWKYKKGRKVPNCVPKK